MFLPLQAECLTCGKPIRDPVALEAWGRHCSARCHHLQGLPVLPHRAA